MRGLRNLLLPRPAGHVHVGDMDRMDVERYRAAARFAAKSLSEQTGCRPVEHHVASSVWTFESGDPRWGVDLAVEAEHALVWIQQPGVRRFSLSCPLRRSSAPADESSARLMASSICALHAWASKAPSFGRHFADAVPAADGARAASIAAALLTAAGVSPLAFKVVRYAPPTPWSDGTVHDADKRQMLSAAAASTLLAHGPACIPVSMKGDGYEIARKAPPTYVSVPDMDAVGTMRTLAALGGPDPDAALCPSFRRPSR